jgi:5'-nucleotidase
LRTYLEQLVAREVRVHVSGVTIVYDSTRAAGSRIVSAVLDGGAPIDPTRQYRLILNDFLATGGDGLGLTSAAIKSEPLSTTDLDALIAHLRALPQPVRAPTEVRIVNRPGAQ